MQQILITTLALLLSCFKSRAALQLENIALRHQISILRRGAPKRLRITRWDRMILGTIHRLWPELVNAVAIVRPATLVRWHRAGFRLLWRWKCGGNGGRPRVDRELRDLIQSMAKANALWGAPRIHGELLKLGIDVSQSTVARYIPKSSPRPSPGWKSFLDNHRHEIASTDFFVVPSLTFKLLFAMVVLDHARRKIVHVAVTAHPTAEWSSQQLSEAFPWTMAPHFLVHDGHGSYRGAFQRRTQTMRKTTLRTAPRSPWQNGAVERVIGSIRRECTDHMIVLNETHLARILKTYIRYYNHARTHLTLNKDTPIPQPVNRNLCGSIVAIPEMGGLHHRYERTAA